MQGVVYRKGWNMSGANAETKSTQYCEKVAQINILTNKIVT